MKSCYGDGSKGAPQQTDTHVSSVFLKADRNGRKGANYDHIKEGKGGGERISDMRGGMYNLYICIVEFTI